MLVLKLLDEVTKNGNKMSLLTDELKSILEDLANLTGPQYHKVFYALFSSLPSHVPPASHYLLTL